MGDCLAGKVMRTSAGKQGVRSIGKQAGTGREWVGLKGKAQGRAEGEQSTAGKSGGRAAGSGRAEQGRGRRRKWR